MPENAISKRPILSLPGWTFARTTSGRLNPASRCNRRRLWSRHQTLAGLRQANVGADPESATPTVIGQDELRRSHDGRRS